MGLGEHGNEIFISIKCEKLFDSETVSFSRCNPLYIRVVSKLHIAFLSVIARINKITNLEAVFIQDKLRI